MGKVAYITGGSRGIGKAVAEELLSQGYDCSITAKDELRLKKTAEELRLKFPKNQILHSAFDVCNEKLVQDSVSKTIEKFGRIDLVFNNAGAYVSGSLELSTEDFENVMKINYFGAASVARNIVPQFMKQKSGYLINLCSVCSKVGFAGVGAYTGSKFALLGLNDSLFHEFADSGIKVTAICPSWVNTDMSSHAPFPKEDMIQPEDIAKTVSYLLSLSKNACPKEITVECLKSPL